MSAAADTRLARRLGLRDAVVVGLGSMIGAGVFAVLAPAAAAAGSWLLVSLAIAAVVAYCNATSSAQLAAVHPQSGGTYVYARERLGRFWGWLAGWCFVAGKLASCAAMALTFGAYLTPGSPRLAAAAAVAAVTAINYLGVRKTVTATAAVLVIVLGALSVVLLTGGAILVQGGSMASAAPDGPIGVLQAGGLFFFTFAGYARIATLGEEVMAPERTIPRAIPLALGLTLALYAAVAASALVSLSPQDLAATNAPLAAVVGAGPLAALAPAIRFGAAAACLSVLLSLLAGVSRTAFAMAANREMPAPLAGVHHRHRVPHRAELTAGLVVAAAVLAVDVRGAIGFSAFCVLAYYALANLSALRLSAAERRWPRALAIAGVAGCVILAATLPLATVLTGAAVIAGGILVYGGAYRRLT